MTLYACGWIRISFHSKGLSSKKKPVKSHLTNNSCIFKNFYCGAALDSDPAIFCLHFPVFSRSDVNCNGMFSSRQVWYKKREEEILRRKCAENAPRGETQPQLRLCWGLGDMGKKVILFTLYAKIHLEPKCEWNAHLRQNFGFTIPPLRCKA